jgi:DNA-binding HxlR family transcriptional regulator
MHVPRCACPTDGVIDLLGKKWTLCIVATVANHEPVRFNRLHAELPSISPKTLSDTLHALQEHGILDRKAFPEVPPRVEYSLTERGRGLVRAIQPFMDWAAGHRQAPCCVA